MQKIYLDEEAFLDSNESSIASTVDPKDLEEV